MAMCIYQTEQENTTNRVSLKLVKRKKKKRRGFIPTTKEIEPKVKRKGKGLSKAVGSFSSVNPPNL